MNSKMQEMIQYIEEDKKKVKIKIDTLTHEMETLEKEYQQLNRISYAMTGTYTVKDRIIYYVKENQPCTINATLNIGSNDSTVYATVSKMVKAGVLKKDNDGFLSISD